MGLKHGIFGHNVEELLACIIGGSSAGEGGLGLNGLWCWCFRSEFDFFLDIFLGFRLRLSLAAIAAMTLALLLRLGWCNLLAALGAFDLFRALRGVAMKPIIDALFLASASFLQLLIRSLIDLLLLLLSNDPQIAQSLLNSHTFTFENITNLPL